MSDRCTAATVQYVTRLCLAAVQDPFGRNCTRQGLWLPSSCLIAKPGVALAGLITPKEALEEACKNLKAVCTHMKQTFRSEMEANGVPVSEDGIADAAAMEA